MSSYLNATTGDCISGACKSLESIPNRFVIITLIVGIFLIGIGLTISFCRNCETKQEKPTPTN